MEKFFGCTVISLDLLAFFQKVFCYFLHIFIFEEKKLVITKVPKDLPTVKISVDFTLDSIS